MRFFVKKHHHAHHKHGEKKAASSLTNETNLGQEIPRSSHLSPKSSPQNHPSAFIVKKNQSRYPRRLYIKCEGQTIRVNDDEHPFPINNGYFTGMAVFRVRDFDGVTPLNRQAGFDDGSSMRVMEERPVIPDSPYFIGHDRTFSLQISGRFKHAWTADDVMFGTFFEKPLVLPRGYSLALGLARRIDSSMVAVLDSPQPYMCSPLICAMNAFNVQPLWTTPANNRHSQSGKGMDCLTRMSNASQDTFSLHTLVPQGSTPAPIWEPLELPEWQWSNGRHLTEQVITEWTGTKAAEATDHNFHIRRQTEPAIHHDTDNKMFSSTDALGGDGGCESEELSTVETEMADSNHNPKMKSGKLSNLSGGGGGGRYLHTDKHRRAYFLNTEHRKRFIYHPDTLYTFDFFSRYVDLNTFQLKLGFTFDVSYYLQGQPVRYQCRTLDGRVTFFTVELGIEGETTEDVHQQH